MTRSMRLVLAASFVASLLILAVSMSPVGEAMGKGNSQSCFLRLTMNPPQGAEVLVIGSSRTRRSIDPEILSVEMGLEKSAALNLGHPAISLPHDYAIIDKMTRDKSYRIVLTEVLARSHDLATLERELDSGSTPNFRLISGTFHRNLYVIGAPISDQIRRVSQSTDNTGQASWDLARIVSTRIATVMTKVFAVRPLKRLFVSGTINPDRTTMCMVKAWEKEGDQWQLGNPAQLALKAAYQDTFLDKPASPDANHLDFFVDAETELMRQTVHDIVELAKARGYLPVFFYLPSTHVPVEHGALQSRFKEEFGAELLVPDETLRRQLEDGGYVDNSHLNNNGRALFSPWIAREIDRIASGS